MGIRVTGNGSIPSGSPRVSCGARLQMPTDPSTSISGKRISMPHSIAVRGKDARMAETPAAHTEPYAASRTKALESLLVEKGLLTTEFIDAIVRRYEQDIGPLKGAQVVARAWVDDAFRARL